MIATKSDFSLFTQILSKVLMIEGTQDTIDKAILGVGGNYIEITNENITMVCNGRRVTADQIIDCWERYDTTMQEEERQTIAEGLVGTDAEFDLP